jgi:glycerol kinase
MLQRLADLLDAPVDRPCAIETTALGAGYLAGLQAGFYPPPDVFAARRAIDTRFLPSMAADERERRYRGWSEAVRRTLLRAA